MGLGFGFPPYAKKDITYTWEFDDLDLVDIVVPMVLHRVFTNGQTVYNEYVPGIESIRRTDVDVTTYDSETQSWTGQITTLESGVEYIFRINCKAVNSFGVGSGGMEGNWVVIEQGIEWEQNFSLETQVQKSVQDLLFVVQSGNDFRGRVLLDDFEVYESYEFIPDVDVRKKISVGNYGTADLTKYYDKDLQPNEYNDSIAPLEAQFYFYPTYPTDKVFDVTRTPIYQDFKKGLFYIYDVDWGDGSPNEFVNEPEQINENTALYHTYETHGVFEITGFMMRLKTNKLGEPEGLIHNKYKIILF